MWAEFYNHISLKNSDQQCKSKGATKMNLAKYLLASNSLSRRTVKPRFWWIILSIIVAILFIALWDKLAPTSFVTSRYMQFVVSGYVRSMQRRNS